MIVKQDIIIHAPIADVYDRFANIHEWKNILPDVLDIDTIYDDGYHQEFKMTVERPTGNETIRAVRYCIKNSLIEIFQPIPPPIFSKMSGIWKFENIDSKTLVISIRNFQLKKDITFDEKMVASNLNKILFKNLNLFKDAIEKNRED
ncbi:MAG: SRPBCC family protein [bacterium]